MSHRWCVIAATTVGIFAAVGSSAQAAPVTFSYEGEISSALAFTASGGPFDFNPSHKPIFDAFIGTTLRFEITVETDSSLNPDTSSDNNRGTYLADISVSFGSNSYLANGHLSIRNDFFVNPSAPNIDDLTAGTLTLFPVGAGPDIAGLAVESFRMQLLDSAGTVFSDDSIPVNQPDPSNFDTNGASITFSKTESGVTRAGALTVDNMRISGQNTSISEPGALAFFGLGLIGLGYIRRHRKYA